MALNNTGSAGLSVEMKTFYDRVLLERTMPVLLHDKFAQKKSIPAHGGKIIEFYPGQILTKEERNIKWSHDASDEVMAAYEAQ